MVIAFDASSQNPSNGSATSTYSHTCSGSDRILIVGVGIGTGKTLISVTYNGVAMTQINSQSSGGSTFDNVHLFQLVAPATGANNIVITASAATNIYSTSESYTGVDQTIPIDVNGTNTNTGITITGSLITTRDNTWIVGHALKTAHTAAISWTSGANTTERQEEASNGWYSSMDTNSDQTPAGIHSITTTVSVSHDLAMNYAALNSVITEIIKEVSDTQTTADLVSKTITKTLTETMTMDDDPIIPTIAQSTSVDLNNGIITTAKIDITYTGNEPFICLTADGTNFEEVTNNINHFFTNTGQDLRFKIIGSETTIQNIKISGYRS